MKWTIFAGLLTTFCFLIGLLSVLALNNQQTVPNITFTDLQGQPHQLTDFQDKIVILNFWATWCPPCVKEFPILLDVAKNNDVVLIALSSDQTEEAVKNFIPRFENINADNIIIALDTQNITLGQFQINGLPETWVINQNQELVGKLWGADWEAKDLQQIIDDNL